MTPPKDFYQGLNGPFTSEGYQPVAKRGATERIDTTAFFMPEDAAAIRPVISEIEFADGTMWKKTP